jgi:hypothetical protein
MIVRVTPVKYSPFETRVKNKIISAFRIERVAGKEIVELADPWMQTRHSAQKENLENCTMLSKMSAQFHLCL